MTFGSLDGNDVVGGLNGNMADHATNPSTVTVSACKVGLMNEESPSPFEIAQRLVAKHCSPGGHSSPHRQGVVLTQFWMRSSQVILQNFVLTVGALDGVDVVDAVSKLIGNVVNCMTDSSTTMLTAGALDGNDVVGELDTGCLDGFNVPCELGASSGCIDYCCMDKFEGMVGGGQPLAQMADSYCTMQLGTKKHPL